MARNRYPLAGIDYWSSVIGVQLDLRRAIFFRGAVAADFIRGSLFGGVFKKRNAETLGFVSCRDDHAAHVIPAFRADNMGGNRSAALRADRQVFRLQSIVCTTLAGSGIGLFSLGNCHGLATCYRPVFRESRILTTFGPATTGNPRFVPQKRAFWSPADQLGTSRFPPFTPRGHPAT